MRIRVDPIHFLAARNVAFYYEALASLVDGHYSDVLFCSETASDHRVLTDRDLCDTGVRVGYSNWPLVVAAV